MPPTTPAVPEGARLTSTPLIVAAAPPGTRVCPPAIDACAEAVLAVGVCEPSVRTGALPGGRFWVWVPTMSAVAEGAREMGVEFMVRTGAMGLGVTKRALVMPLMMMADAEGAREKVDPEIVRGREPGARVWLPMMNWEKLSAEMVCESSVMAG